MSNLYWPVYKNLEKEIINLSFSVNFDDKQFEYLKNDEEFIKTPPYSVKIGDLLIRCCTEIEALIKELTKGKDEDIKKIPSVDSNKPITTGCRLKYLHKIWGLHQKTVYVSCISMYFQNQENQHFTPFDYTKYDLNDYYSAYNAIKHNRNVKTIYKGNIRFLLRAMASLFLLNLYYKDEIISLGKTSSTDSVLSGSEIFAVETIRAATTDYNNTLKLTFKQFKEVISAVYIIKVTEKSLTKNNEAANKYLALRDKNLKALIKNSPQEDIESLKKKSFEMISIEELSKTVQSSEYEAVTVKPDYLEFYESQGCISDLSSEEIKDIKEKSLLWKSDCSSI